MFENIIFDLDGTLVDSSGDIIDCLRKTYSAVPTSQILKKIRKEYFSDIVAPDYIPSVKMEKTHMISHLIEKWNLNRKECIMIGDSDADIRAALENGIASVAVLSGYGDKKSIVAVNPDYTVERVSLLYGLLSNLQSYGGK